MFCIYAEFSGFILRVRIVTEIGVYLYWDAKRYTMNVL